MDGSGEEELNGCIFTADRWYGKEAFLIGIMFRIVFVMPDNWLRVHPFDGLSFLNPFWGDLEEEVLKASF